LEIRSREALEYREQSLLGGSGGSSEEQNADRNVNRKDCAYDVSMGRRPPLGIRLEALHATLWQGTCLHFVYALRLCGRLNAKDSPAFRPWHGYFWLPLARGTMRIVSQKQSEKI
jgi:hypothetical protein